MKCILTTAIFSLIASIIAGQNPINTVNLEDTGKFHFRELVVEMDTVFEDPSDHYRPNKGLKVTITDNLFRILTFNEYRNKKRNGLSMSFFPISNMPQERGQFTNDQKNGEWFYWNEQGILFKTEYWRNGKLTRRKNKVSS